MGFYLLSEIVSKNIGKNIGSCKYSQKLLDHAKQSATDSKPLQKDSFKNKQKQLKIWLVTKLLIELRKSQNVHHRIIQKQLQTNMTKKYLMKDISPEERQKTIDDLWLI